MKDKQHLPKHWIEIKLSELIAKGDKINYGVVQPGDNVDSGIPLVRVGDFVSKKIDINQLKKIDSNIDKKYSKSKLFGDEVLLACVGSIGAVGLANSSLAGANIARAVARIRCSDDVDRKYIYWYLQSSRPQNYFLNETRTVSQPTLNIREIGQTPVPLPPLEEQRRIAAILDKADEVRRKRQEAIRLTEELLRSLFLDMFGDPVTNPKGWKEVTIDDLVTDVRDGPHVSPEYSDEGIPILSTRNIRPSKLIMDDIKFVSQETYQELVKKFKPQQGDVLLTKGGTTGYAKAVDWGFPFAIWVHIAALRPTKEVRAEFLESALNSHNCYIQSQRFTHGIANRDLGLTRIRKIRLSLPPLDLQNEYCSCREKMLDQISSQEKALQVSDNFFNSLLQRAFRGEL